MAISIRHIPGLPGYAASRDGRIWSKYVRGDNRRTLGDKWNPLSPATCKGGRQTLVLNGSTAYVHHLILITFVGPQPQGLEACHFDGDASNNSVENLRWDTHSGNELDKIRHGTHNRGERHGMSKLSNAEVVAIKIMLSRHTKPHCGIQKFLCEWFGVKNQAISKIARGTRHNYA